jgi:hypothetical protein
LSSSTTRELLQGTLAVRPFALDNKALTTSTQVIMERDQTEANLSKDDEALSMFAPRGTDSCFKHHHVFMSTLSPVRDKRGHEIRFSGE